LICYKNLFKLKQVLKSAAIDEDVAILFKDHVYTILLESFWKNVDSMIQLIEPIVNAITLLEGDKPIIHKVYPTVKNLMLRLIEVVEEIDLEDLKDKKTLLDNISKRLKNIVKPVHIAAHLLNPKTLGNDLTNEEHIDVSEFINNFAMNSYDLNDEDCLTELINYKNKEGLYSKTFLWKTVSKLEPLIWWKSFNSSLSKLAQKILSIPVSSAATERSFSSFANVHSKKRNRLLTERAAKLTYISHNWKTLDRNKNDEDDNNSEIEDFTQNETTPFILQHGNSSHHREKSFNLNLTQEESDLESASSGTENEQFSLHDTDTSLGFSCTDHDSEKDF